MKKITTLSCLAFVLIGCYQGNLATDFKSDKWEDRKVNSLDLSRLNTGLTYLPVYSQIYHVKEGKQVDLTTTVSIRNMHSSDTVYILKADYYNGDGEKIKSYTDSPIYLKPKESIEIVIANNDNDGSTGANFNFNWATPNKNKPILFEALMISTKGQQGLSFSTRGIDQNY